jgi:hypothetical protein
MAEKILILVSIARGRKWRQSTTTLRWVRKLVAVWGRPGQVKVVTQLRGGLTGASEQNFSRTFVAEKKLERMFKMYVPEIESWREIVPRLESSFRIFFFSRRKVEEKIPQAQQPWLITVERHTPGWLAVRETNSTQHNTFLFPRTGPINQLKALRCIGTQQFVTG